MLRCNPPGLGACRFLSEEINMPIYEFYCQDCGLQFEKLVLSSQEKIHCPVCRQTNVAKMMSACSLKTDCKVPST
jgi:putative FmdB family regulatory protein